MSNIPLDAYIDRCYLNIDRINYILRKSKVNGYYYLKHMVLTTTYRVCFDSNAETFELIESNNIYEIVAYLNGVLDLLDYLTDKRRM